MCDGGAILTVLKEYPGQDVGIARISDDAMDELGLSDGDEVRIKDGKTVVAEHDGMGNLAPGEGPAVDSGTIRLNWSDRPDGVSVGDEVVVGPTGGVVAVDTTDNPNAGIEGATWDAYEKKRATWAIKLPRDVTVHTSHGPVEAEGGDYLCINPVSGTLYPVDGDSFEKMYESVGSDGGPGYESG